MSTLPFSFGVNLGGTLSIDEGSPLHKDSIHFGLQPTSENEKLFGFDWTSKDNPELTLLTRINRRLDLQELLDKLLVRTLTLMAFDQSSPNFPQMLRTIRFQPNMIAIEMAWVTQELWPLIYRNCLFLCLKFITNNSYFKRSVNT